MKHAFAKMHGLGNDFVVIDERAAPVAMTGMLARAIADRHTGIGCDQLILIGPSDRADVAMRIFNSDGSEVEACGNATRCVPLFVGRDVSIETVAGILNAASTGDLVTVDMGEPGLEWSAIPLAYAMDTLALPVSWEDLPAPAVANIGNPHVVFFLDDKDAVDMARLGPLIEHDPLFPERVNVNFAQVIAPDHIALTVWERGAGFTRACGTGACATAVCAIRRKLVQGPVRVSLAGGDLVIDWAPGGRIMMTGPATHVYDGMIDLGAFGPGMSGPEIITLGCRLNIAESEAIRQQLGGRDDLIVVNSCAVTGEAVRQTRQAIRRASRRRPDARIIVTGCAAQTDPAMFAAMPEVAQVIGNDAKPQFAATLARAEPVAVADIMAVEQDAPQLLSAFAERVRGFVVVQNGCDHRCTFCIIPFGRGPSRSVPAGAVVDQVRRLVDEGVQEIVLTGVDVTSYGPDLPGAPSLGALVERILTHVPALPRLRLSSLDGIEIDERLLELLIGEKKVMPHVHLSLQAGDDMILKRMKRRHNRTQSVQLAEKLHASRPEIAIGADIIAGFPTETEAMFENSLALAADCRIVHGHVFPYSPRAGTPASRMPPVDPGLIRERAARLRDACAAQRASWLTGLIGTEQSILVETSGLMGHAENFAPVRFAAPQAPGTIVTSRITGLEDGALMAHGPAHG